MGEFVTFMEEDVKPQGLNKKARPQKERIKECIFSEDYCNLVLLEKIAPLKIKENPLLFYPGCGADVLFPLLYLERLFPKLKEVQMHFVDIHHSLNLLKTVLHHVGVSFAQENETIRFYWKELFVSLRFQQADVFQNLPENFDIYFEKAFGIMKQDAQDYETKIFERLSKNGVLISDSGFKHVPLKRIKISPELSSYRDMVLGIKEARKRPKL